LISLFLSVLLANCSFPLLGAVSFTPLSILNDPLGTLKPQHPRILATAVDFIKLKETVKADPDAAKMARYVILKADEDLAKPLLQHVIPDGLRLLATSREMKVRMLTLGLAWQLTGDKKYPKRAWNDLEAVGNFPDWNPKHFLDVAEMSLAFAVGLDWMNEAWTAAQKEQICQWIIKQGLEPAMIGYTDRNTKTYKMLRAAHNWGQVTNGGIGAGALAIADLHPDQAREPLRYALQCIQPSLASYAPDGGWAEGYGYYGYAMEYATAFLSSLQNSLGTDFGLSKIPGFSFAPDFPIYMEGPCGNYFGFADCGEGDHVVSSFPCAGWAAMHFTNSVSAANQRTKAIEHPSAMGLLWLPPEGDLSKIANSPRVKEFSEVGCATLRTKWGDTNAAFAGLKAGDNKVNHSHLDIGHFVYDAAAMHWVIDLGAENYNLISGARWDFYRLRAEGNNSLVVNPGRGPDQSPKANAKMVLCADRGDSCVAIADITTAYPDLISSKRGLRLANNGSLRIQDELDSGGKEASALCFMHTPATINISTDGHSATLSQEGRTLRAYLLSPADAKFETMAATPLPTSPNPLGQNANKGITKLVVRTAFKNKCTIVVDLTPEGEKLSTTTVIPLSSW
jgi:hypothetical protein